VIKNVESRIRSFDANLRDQIHRDIELLQICPSPRDFEVALKLFSVKWKEMEGNGGR
jgi:hypothetical protein